MTAISNSSPLILLTDIGLETLLRDVFAEIIVPPAVIMEVYESEHASTTTRPRSIPPWITVRGPSFLAASRELPAYLGKGETEAIHLALGSNPFVPILLDDLDARRVANQLGLHVLGTAGVLIEAKRQGAILTVRPVLDQLVTIGFRISRRIYDEVMFLTGEGGP